MAATAAHPGLAAAAANAAWFASALPSALAFERSLRDPEATQRSWLASHLKRCAGTAFAREHGLHPRTGAEELQERVPVRGYDELVPWIDRIRSGEPGVLTHGRPERLMPSSGSTAAVKLLPQTPAGRAGFDAAVGPMVVDLFRRHPGAARGGAYWSVTPPAPPPAVESAVPIGFEDDAAYLGGLRAALARRVFIEPVGAADRGGPGFLEATVRGLLARRDLALVSVWHPSFLSLLLDVGEAEAGVRDWRAAWPRLRVVSAWADAHAAGPFAALSARLPWVAIEPKGLLATEGAVTVPRAGRSPVALRSGFFEFLCADGRARLAHELDDGGSYEVVMTTGGGLWRCRLGDRVRVEGFVHATPSLRLLGRADAVVDLAGEKLSSGFVGGVLARLLPAHPFTLLFPADDARGYVLHAAAPLPAGLAAALDAALVENPHYALCRRLGQLREVEVRPAPPDAYRRVTDRLVAGGRRLGDLKPEPLSGLPGWSRFLD